MHSPRGANKRIADASIERVNEGACWERRLLAAAADAAHRTLPSTPGNGGARPGGRRRRGAFGRTAPPGAGVGHGEERGERADAQKGEGGRAAAGDSWLTLLLWLALDCCRSAPSSSTLPSLLASVRQARAAEPPASSGMHAAAEMEAAPPQCPLAPPRRCGFSCAAGVLLALEGRLGWLWFSAGVLAFLAQHALQGWCVPARCLGRRATRAACRCHLGSCCLRCFCCSMLPRVTI